MFVDYFLMHHKSELLQIVGGDDISRHYAVNINFLELFTTNASLGNDLLRHPEAVLKEFDTSLQNVQHVLAKQHPHATVKPNTHTRVFGVPICPELHKSLLPGNDDLGSFLQISGTVVRMMLPKMLEFQREYICAKCKYKVTVQADLEQRYTILPPKICTNPEVCKGSTLVLNEQLDVSSSCKDYQEVKIQEQLSKLGMGKMPSSVWVVVEDDLVDICKPGDNVTVCGIVKRRWKPQYVDRELKVELFLKANHVQVNNDNSSVNLVSPGVIEQHESFWVKYRDNPFKGRSIILKSICPEIYGLFIVKLALAVVLAGGSQLKENESTITARSHPHLLLVGDPGTGKSQLLHFASKVVPRSVLTTGIGSTSAGLTVTAVMEDGEWHLEGGALVMADGGICCIDEFNSMKKQDRTSIHEAMEQQTISVAKAGVVCKLHTRCTVLAAMNPKCGVDLSQPFGMNVNMASPLLSRFDIVLHLRDKINNDWDDLVAEYVLNGEIFEDCKKDSPVWNLEMLQSYFMLIKQRHPVLTPHASEILSSYYQAQRVIASRNKARTTVRLLDSLIRLSQGHARLMFHQEVQMTDAIIAVVLMEVSLQDDASLLSLNFDLNSDFPENSRDWQDTLNQIVLEKLDLVHLLELDENVDHENCLTRQNANVASFLNEFKFSTDRKVLARNVEKDREFNIPENSAENKNASQKVKNVLLKECNEGDIGSGTEKTDKEIIEHPLQRSLENHEQKHVSVRIQPNKRKRRRSITLNDRDDSRYPTSTLTEDLPVTKEPNDAKISKNDHNAAPIASTSKHKSKMEAFRFKPRVEPTENKHVGNGMDINQMLNLIPSVADDFDIENYLDS